MQGKLGALLTSRKFWFSVVTAGVELYLFASGKATADVVAGSLAALGSAYVVATGIEDSGNGPTLPPGASIVP